MTTIRTTCPRCGEVDMGPESILLSVMQGGREGSYRFTCPSCSNAVEKRADRKIVALLVSAGVDVTGHGASAAEETTVPIFDGERFRSPDGRPEGPPLTVDDLIDFHFLLEDDRYVQSFFARRG
jgi:hypothetical protein